MNNSINFFGYPAPIRAPVPFRSPFDPSNQNQVRNPTGARNLLPDRPAVFPVRPPVFPVRATGRHRVSDPVRPPDDVRDSGPVKDPYSVRLKKEREKWFRIKKQLDKYANTILQEFGVENNSVEIILKIPVKKAHFVYEKKTSP